MNFSEALVLLVGALVISLASTRAASDSVPDSDIAGIVGGGVVVVAVTIGPLQMLFSLLFSFMSLTVDVLCSSFA